MKSVHIWFKDKEFVWHSGTHTKRVSVDPGSGSSGSGKAPASKKEEVKAFGFKGYVIQKEGDHWIVKKDDKKVSWGLGFKSPEEAKSAISKRG